jgi:hypothetical protein
MLIWEVIGYLQQEELHGIHMVDAEQKNVHKQYSMVMLKKAEL